MAQNEYPVGTKVQIISRTATVIEPERPRPETGFRTTMVRYHDDENHCWVPTVMISEVIEAPSGESSDLVEPVGICVGNYV